MNKQTQRTIVYIERNPREQTVVISGSFFVLFYVLFLFF